MKLKKKERKKESKVYVKVLILLLPLNSDWSEGVDEFPRTAALTGK